MLLQATELPVRMDKAGLLHVPPILLGRFDPFTRIALAHGVATAVLKIGQTEQFLQCQFNKEIYKGRE